MSNPPRICSFESRRAAEMSRLIEKMGGQPTVAPSMQEVPLKNNPAVFEFADQLFAGAIQCIVFMTGVGAKALLDVIETKYSRDDFLDCLRKTTVMIRGPKPAVVLKDWNVPYTVGAPELNTWCELIAEIDRSDIQLAGQTVAVQEYGIANDEFYDALREREATVLPVTVYRWTLPDDTGPLEAAIRATIAGEFDALVVTSANQVRNVLAVAEKLGQRDAWLSAAKECVVASVGPTCSITIRDEGLSVDYEASPPKMGPLVRGTIETVTSR